MPHRFTALNEAQWASSAFLFNGCFCSKYLKKKNKFVVVGPGELGISQWKFSCCNGLHRQISGGKNPRVVGKSNVFHFRTGRGEHQSVQVIGFTCSFPRLWEQLSPVFPSRFVGWLSRWLTKKPPIGGLRRGRSGLQSVESFCVQKPMTPATVARSGFRFV